MGIRLRRRLGGVLWGLGVLVAIGWSTVQGAKKDAFPGLGREHAILIASEFDGRIASVEVELHDPVASGDVVLRLDPARAELEREVASAEILALTDAPMLDPDEEVERLQDEARSRQVQAELGALEARIRSLERLLQSGAASQAELDQALARRKVLQLKLERAAPEEIEVASAWSVVAALRRLDEVEARVEGFTLRSALEGQVAAVLRRPGEVVKRGEPLLRVERPNADEVITWVHAHKVPKPGASAVVERSDGSHVTGEVVSVSAGSDLMPEQIWTIPGRPQYGVAVRVKLTDAVRPREPVRVFL